MIPNQNERRQDKSGKCFVAGSISRFWAVYYRIVKINVQADNSEEIRRYLEQMTDPMNIGIDSAPVPPLIIYQDAHLQDVRTSTYDKEVRQQPPHSPRKQSCSAIRQA